MKTSMEAICQKYGIKTIHYSFITFGQGAGSVAHKSFSYSINNYQSSSSLKTAIGGLTITSGSGGFAVEAALSKCKTSFQDAKVRRSADRVVVLMMDEASSSSIANLKSMSDALGYQGVRIIPVGIGLKVRRQELLTISSNEHDIIQVKSSATAAQLESKIMYSTYRCK